VLVRNGVEARGLAAVKESLAKVYRAFPDIEYRIDDAVAAGGKIALRWQGRGTHRGEYLGLAPTGLEVSYDGITIFETRGDRIARLWVSADMLGLARRLGAWARAGEQAGAHA
jgi:predicted ester cyclase